MRDIKDRSHARYKAAEKINGADSPAHRNTGVARSNRRKTDRVQRSPECGTMEQNPISGEDKHQDDQLCRDCPEKIALPKEQQRFRKVRVIKRTLGQTLCDP